MTPYIVITIAAVGMLAALPLVRHWERQQRKHEKRR